MYILGDIGGTRTRISSSDDLKTFTEPLIFETPKEYNHAINMIEEVTKKVKQDSQVQAVCFGVSGILSKEKDALERSPHLPNWERMKFKKELQRINETDKVFLENDTAIVGLGEATFGVGKDYKLIAYITISTGVGGVRIEDKKIDTKIYGFEPGHQILSVNGDLFSLEQLISGSGIKALTGKEAREVEDSEFWEKVTRNTAIGIHNTILHWSPEAVVLGGGVIQSGKLSVHQIHEVVQELLIVFPETPDILKSELGDFGGLYGAMEYLKQML